MRRTVLVACSSAVLAALVACATAEDGSTAPPQDDAGPSVITDAGPEPSADGSPPEVAPIPACSAAGWCPTALPDADLMLKDIWPLPGRAFAIAESATLGVKVLEWEDSEAKWKYIDDNSQNQGGFGAYAANIWASNADEVFYSVSFGTIVHGRRPAPPETKWTWERHRLEDHSPDAEANPDHDHGYRINKYLEFFYPTLGVRGVGGDVYAWYANTLYRWASAGGGPSTFVVDYSATDIDAPDEHIFFVDATAASAEEAWFVGVRQRTVFGADVDCPLVMRKTAGGYERIFDGDTSASCAERMGVAPTGGWGWILDLHALPGNRFAGIQGGRELALISRSDEGSYSVEHAPIRLGLYDRPFYSAYLPADDQLWLSGMGIVVQGDASIWDGGTFGVSTISLNGGPINRPMYKIRGTSDTNMWAVGVRYALHKTTH